MSDSQKRSVVFVHPDLGIGGAERLIIDAAVGLQDQGHKVAILTSHRDPKHCFEEARDGTLDVRVRGNALFPSVLFGGLSIVFAILRQLALVFSVCIFSSELRTLAPDVIIVDQLSICIPFFRVLYPKAQILFYGHFPDQLLTKKTAGLTKYVKKVYRFPFDLLEGWSTSCADVIAVNSKFTKVVYRHTFPGLRANDLKVIYPCVDTLESGGEDEKSAVPLWPGKKLLLSINRFEGYKNLPLALKAYAGLSSAERANAKLVIAGGFDPRSAENASTHASLQRLAEELKLTHATFRSNDTLTTDLTTDDVDVLFLLSIPNELKNRLLHSASLLLYTPENEHFGIVPLEAMLAGVPVLATNTGGPLETIYDGRTGWLRSAKDVSAWTEIMGKLFIPSSASNLTAMGQKGRERVLADFSRTKMVASFEREIDALCVRTAKKEPRVRVTPDWVLALAMVTAISVVAGTAITFVFIKMINTQEERYQAALAKGAARRAVEAITTGVAAVTAAVGKDEL